MVARTAASRLYRARDEQGRLVALKELVFTQVPSVEALDAFEREARVLRQLEHPAIPRFIESFREGSGVGLRLYLAQAFVDGESLASRLTHHRFTEDELLSLAEQALEVLVFLQQLTPPVFHRDVKPQNLMLRPEGQLMLVDFGAARELGETGGGTLVGTFGYMPTE